MLNQKIFLKQSSAFGKPLALRPYPLPRTFNMYRRRSADSDGLLPLGARTGTYSKVCKLRSFLNCIPKNKRTLHAIKSHLPKYKRVWERYLVQGRTARGHDSVINAPTAPHN